LTFSSHTVLRTCSTRASGGIPFHKLGRCMRLLGSDVRAHIAAARVEVVTDSDIWRTHREVA
jgi:hypothetical protein